MTHCSPPLRRALQSSKRQGLAADSLNLHLLYTFLYDRLDWRGVHTVQELENNYRNHVPPGYPETTPCASLNPGLIYNPNDSYSITAIPTAINPPPNAPPTSTHPPPTFLGPALATLVVEAMTLPLPLPLPLAVAVIGPPTNDPVPVAPLALDTVTVPLSPLTAGNTLSVVHPFALSGQTSARSNPLSSGPVGPDSYFHATFRFRKLDWRGSEAG